MKKNALSFVLPLMFGFVGFINASKAETIATVTQPASSPSAPSKVEAVTPAKDTTSINQLFTDKDLPIAGKPTGKVMVAEFFDYSCSHCKENHSVVSKLIGKGEVNFKFIEFPILGSASMMAAKAALAAGKQGKYLEMHNKLMQASEDINTDVIMKFVDALSLNKKKFKDDYTSATLNQQIDKNLRLAKELKIEGTPSFVIGSSAANAEILPGSLTTEEIDEKVKQFLK